MAYKSILNELNKKYNGNNFVEFVKEAFAQTNNNWENINEMFLQILISHSCSIEEINIMIEHGADILYKNGSAFCYICQNKDINVLLYFLEKYAPDVNSIKSSYLYRSMTDDAFQILIDKGLIINDNIIYELLSWDPMQYDYKKIQLGKKIEILIKNGVSISKLIDIYLSETSYMSFISSFLLKKIINTNIFYQISCETINKLMNISIDSVYLQEESSLSLEEIRILFNMGADPRYNDDTFFITLCSYVDDPEVLSTLIDEYKWDINAQNSNALIYAINYYKYDIVKLLLDRGSLVTNDAILTSFNRIDIFVENGQSHGHVTTKYLDLLIEYGSDIVRIAKLLVDEIFKKTESYHESMQKNKLVICKKLINMGIDMNQMILNHNEEK